MPLPTFANAENAFYSDALAGSPTFTSSRTAVTSRTAAQIRLYWTNLTITVLPVLFSLAYLCATAANTYGPSHLLLTYSHGFLKRALMGTLFAPLGFLSTGTLLHIQIAAFITLAGTTCWLFRRILLGTVQERCFGVFVLAGPALLPHFAYMSGELDTYLFIVTVLALGALFSVRGVPGVLLATSASVAGLLIHEAFALMFYPLILAVAVDLHRRQRMARRVLAAHFAIVLSAFLAILHFGKLGAHAPAAMAAAQQRTDMPLEPTVFLVLGSTLREQLTFVSHLYTPRLVAGVALTVLVSIPYFAILVSLLQKALHRNGSSVFRTRLLLLVLAGSPLLLCFLGHDAMRWISASAINVSLYLLYLYRIEPEGSPVRNGLTAWTATAAFPAALAYMLVLGPNGIASNRLVANLGVLLSHLH